MRLLKILIIGMKWPPETFLRRLIDGLLRAAPDIEITVALPKRPAVGWAHHDRLHWLHTPSWTDHPLSRVFWLVWHAMRSLVVDAKYFSGTTRYAMDKTGWSQRYATMLQYLPFASRTFDLVYFPWNNAAIAYDSPLLKYPRVISCRGSQVNIAPHNPKRSSIVVGLKRSFHEAVVVHCVSEAIRERARVYGLKSERSRIIRPAVDTGVFKPTVEKLSGRVFTIVSTGSLIWTKGLEYALMTMAFLSESGVHAELRIIGDGEERQRILYCIDDLGLQDRVKLKGQLPPGEVLHVLRSAHVFLLSSLSEGISNAVLEAMACGLPVVTTDAGGMREAVRDGVDGFVVPVRDPKAMAAALKSLCDDETLRKNMGQRARQRVVEHFNLRDQVRLFDSLFREVSERRAELARAE